MSTELLVIPPGEVLLALAIGVSESRINTIVKGRRAISADTDLRLCRFFGLSDGFWLRMQTSHDLTLAKHTLEGVLSTIQSRQPSHE